MDESGLKKLCSDRWGLAVPVPLMGAEANTYKNAWRQGLALCMGSKRSCQQVIKLDHNERGWGALQGESLTRGTMACHSRRGNKLD